jgi:hypothetical protein
MDIQYRSGSFGPACWANASSALNRPEHIKAAKPAQDKWEYGWALVRFSSPFSNMRITSHSAHLTIAWTSFHNAVTLRNANAENTSGMNGFFRA